MINDKLRGLVVQRRIKRIEQLEAEAKEILRAAANEQGVLVCSYCGRDHDVKDCGQIDAEMHIAGQITGPKNVVIDD